MNRKELSKERKKLMQSIAGVAISTGLSIVSGGFSNVLLGGVISGIAGGAAANYIDKIEFEKLKSLFKDNEFVLNNDLHEVIVEAVENSILNIEKLYLSQISLDYEQKKRLKIFIKLLVEDVDTMRVHLSEKANDFFRDIETPQSTKDLLNSFDLEIYHFPLISKENSFRNFFKDHFENSLQLCFGELIKSEQNRSAYIDYQREIYQSLEKNIDQIIRQNSELIGKVNSMEKTVNGTWKNKNWKALRNNIRNRSVKSISPEFEESLNLQLEEIRVTNDLLIEIKGSNQMINRIVVDHTRALRENWVSKNKVLVLTVGVSICLIVVWLVSIILSSPFTMRAVITDNSLTNVHLEYPKLSSQSRVRFYLPYETLEKEITFSKEMVISDIPHDIKGQKCKVELIDRYWELRDDSITINNGLIELAIRPNRQLSKIEGTVHTRDGQTPIVNAIVEMEELSVKTDVNGRFSMEIPIERRRIYYDIRIEKEGYIAETLEYVAQDVKPVRLNKIEDE